jgi:hypothetical protein
MKIRYNNISKSLISIIFTLLFGINSQAQISYYPYEESFDTWATSTKSALQTNSNKIELNYSWKNISDDDFEWRVNSGATRTHNTGPSYGYDHHGNYIYVESTFCCSKKGSIIMPLMDFSNLQNPQLSFYYYMYGKDMGSLCVEVSLDNGKTWQTSVWTKKGQQENRWKYAAVSLKNYSGVPELQIRFTAETGNGNKSDIAIDNVVVSSKAPSFLKTKSISTSAVELQWTENGHANLWEIEYGISGFTLGTGVRLLVKNTSDTTISNLLDDTPYDIYVRSIYSTDIKSEFSEPISIKTLSNPQSESAFIQQQNSLPAEDYYKTTNDKKPTTKKIYKTKNSKSRSYTHI